jgi:cytochrome oxidase Cu insertion factor (SCO1/SenC/PrrC family)
VKQQDRVLEPPRTHTTARRVVRAVAGCALSIALFCLLGSTQAMADGDPASDVLLSQSVFAPADANASATQLAQLGSLLRAAKSEGFAIRVALIPSDYDLGSVFPLWRDPGAYARFLGVELSNVYRGALLVVMPNGFGVSLPHGETTAIYRRLTRLKPRPKGAQLIAATEAAVKAVVADEGGSLRAPGAAAVPRGSGMATAAIVAASAVALLLFGVVLITRRSKLAALGSGAAAFASRVTMVRALARTRVGMLSVAVCVTAAAAGTIVGLEVAQGSTGPSAAEQPPTEATPFTFRARQHPAPTFRLTDQNGRAISLAAFSGKPVIVIFVDPLCRNLCPLAAHVLNQLDRELPPDQRVPIIAVSVDIYADSRPDLLQDYRRWGLVPQWHWAVGTPAQLASVWHDYGVEVLVQTKHIAGTTVHFISHYELAYVVDPTGYLRDLFLWPYAATDVERALAKL